MRNPLPAITTRTEDRAERELPLRPVRESPRPTAIPERRPADRIKDALLRWLEEEM